MSTINGSKKNIKLIEKISEAIETIFVTSKQLDNDMVVSIDGKKIVTDEIEHYKKLKKVKEILSFADKDTTDLYEFEEIYIEKTRQEELFKLANDEELGIKFPESFGQFGEIPGTQGIYCPRPKSSLETIEEYEEYLKKHYKAADFEASFDEEGYRKPYPHEKYIWSKGKATASTDQKYVSDYYKQYKSWKSKKKTSPDNESEPTLNNSEQKNKNIKEQIVNARKNLRKKLGKIFKPKNKTTLSDYFKNPIGKIKDTKNNLTTKENWPKLKKVLIGAAIAVGGIVVLQGAGIPLLSIALTGLTQWPTMIASALTGVMAKGGALVTLTAFDRIVMGLIGASIPVGLFGIVKNTITRLEKKKVKKEPAKTTEPTKAETKEDTNEETKEETKEDTKEETKEETNEETKAETKEETENEIINIPEVSLNDKINFIKNALIKINEELDIALEEQSILNSSTESTEIKQERLDELSKKIKKLKIKRDAYINELTKLVKIDDFEDKPNIPNEKTDNNGGIKK